MKFLPDRPVIDDQTRWRNKKAITNPIVAMLTTTRLAESQFPENSTIELTIIGPMVCPMPAPCNMNPAINAMCEGLGEKRAASTKAVPGNRPPKAENRNPAMVFIVGSLKLENTSIAHSPMTVNETVSSFPLNHRRLIDYTQRNKIFFYKYYSKLRIA